MKSAQFVRNKVCVQRGYDRHARCWFVRLSFEDSSRVVEHHFKAKSDYTRFLAQLKS